MYLITAIPIVSIPRPGEQIFSYYFEKSLKRGSLIEVPFSGRMVRALVLKSVPIKYKKIDLKRATFKLSGAKRVVNNESVLSNGEIKFAVWLSEYLFTSLGLVLKTILPSYLLSKKDVQYRTVEQTQGEKFSFSFISWQDRKKNYIKTIKENIKEEKQTLLLFPEFLRARNFFKRLPNSIKSQTLFTSSHLTPKQDYNTRLQVLTGEKKVVIGTRSAIFLSLPNLKTIIVEDEKNDSYKSWDQHPKYDTRIISYYMAQQRELELIWGGNLPSVRALWLIKKENPNTMERIKKDIKASTPKVSTKLVDMRQELKEGNTSPISRDVQESLSKLGKKQAILLMNRRGEYTVSLCRDCGFVLECSKCSSPLITLASDSKNFYCRYCATPQPKPDFCPKCKSHRFRSLGAGVRKLGSELKSLFPQLSVGLIDSDSARSPEMQDKIFNDFSLGKTQILLGTQSILKPSLLPKVSVSVALSLETAMLLPEYAGEETVFNMVVDLAGVAQDNFIWQTYQPEHRVVDYFLKKDYLAFIEDELVKRVKYSWPPKKQLIKLTWVAKEVSRGKEEALIVYKKLGSALPQEITLYEPLESRIFKMRGRYSWNILLAVGSGINIKERNIFLSRVPSRWEVEVDPINTI